MLLDQDLPFKKKPGLGIHQPGDKAEDDGLPFIYRRLGSAKKLSAILVSPGSPFNQCD